MDVMSCGFRFFIFEIRNAVIVGSLFCKFHFSVLMCWGRSLFAILFPDFYFWFIRGIFWFYFEVLFGFELGLEEFAG